MLSPEQGEALTASVDASAADVHAWVSRLEILILDRQHDYIKRILELQLEAALPEADRCPARAARSRAAARVALDEIRRHLAALHDTVGLRPQLARSVRGNINVATEIVKRLPSIAINTSAGDCPICLCDLSSTPEEPNCIGECGSSANTDVVALPCGRGAHRFHRYCIQNWTKLSAKCPLCRQEITERSVRCMTTTPRISQEASTPPVPSDISTHRSDVVEAEVSRLRSQSEGPRGHGLRGESFWHSETLDLGVRRAAPSTEALLDEGRDVLETRSRATPENPTAVVTAVASNYGRALASAAIASAHRCARRATPATPNSSTTSTAPSTPAHRRSRQHINQEGLISALQAHDSVIAADNVQDGFANEVEGLRSDVSETGSAIDTEVQSQSDILDRVVAASFHRHAPEMQREEDIHDQMLPRHVEQVRISSRPPLLQLGCRGVPGSIARSSSPPPLRTDRSERSSATSTPSHSSSVGPSPSTAAIANAASGYGRALAAAAVASSLRLAAARPSAPSENGNLGNLPVNSRTFSHGSVAIGSHGGVLARVGRDVLFRLPPSASRRDDENGSTNLEGREHDSNDNAQRTPPL